MKSFLSYFPFKHSSLIFTIMFGFSTLDVLAGQSSELHDLLIDNIFPLSQEQQIILDRLQNQTSVLDIKAVNVRYDLIEKDTINLNLFPGESISASKSQVITRSPDDYTWIGEYSDSSGHVVLVVKESGITGTVRMDSVIYNIRDIGSGIHVITHMYLDPLRTLCLLKSDSGVQDTIPQHNRNTYDPEGTLQKMSFSIDRASVISTTSPVQTVFVAYTTNSKNSYGGNMPNLIQDAVDETNTAYDRSEISLLAELAGTVEVSYNEIDFETDLNRLVHPSDGFMDNVHSLRNQYLADLVVLIVDNTSACGLATGILAHPSLSFAVVHYECAVDNLTFAHEIGHLQGARHNTEIDSNTYPFPYGHGYCYLGILRKFRTIMAYYCDYPNSDPNRIQNFSNPDVTYWWVPTGDSTLRDNARVLSDETATVLENYRGVDITISGYSIPWGVPGGFLTYLPSEEYLATNSIIAGPDLTIENDGDVIFRSGNKITLKPGFHAKAGSKFRAYIDPGLAASKETTPPVVVDAPVIADAENDLLPTVYSLSHAYPNPFNPVTTIPFGLPEASSVSLVIYDIMGREVIRWDLHEPPGYRQLAWNGTDHSGRLVPSGIYIYRLVAVSTESDRRFTASRKMVLLK